MGTIISKEKAFDIVREFQNELLTIDPEGILALYLIGSLGGGYYRPGQSDIDTILIVKDDARLTQETAEEIAAKYQERYDVPKGFGAVLIYEKELFPPYLKSESDEFEFSVEIARLKTQGLLFYGSYSLDHVPMPTRAHLIKDAKIMENWFLTAFGYPMYDKLDVVSCVNSILIQMRRFLMIEHNIFEFNKFKTVGTYLQYSPAITDEAAFSFIDRFLKGETAGTEQDLQMLRSFGQRLSDYNNRELLDVDAASISQA